MIWTVIVFLAAAAATGWAVSLHRSGDPAWRAAASAALAGLATGFMGLEPRVPWFVVSIAASLGSVVLMWTFRRIIERGRRVHLGE